MLQIQQLKKKKLALSESSVLGSGPQKEGNHMLQTQSCHQRFLRHQHCFTISERDCGYDILSYEDPKGRSPTVSSAGTVVMWLPCASWFWSMKVWFLVYYTEAVDCADPSILCQQLVETPSLMIPKSYALALRHRPRLPGLPPADSAMRQDAQEL